MGVSILDVADKMESGMHSIGYDYPSDIGIPDDRIFGRDPEFRLFLVHVVEHNSKQWKNYLNFRDALRASKSLSIEYADLKTEIIKKHPVDRAMYTELK